MSEQEKEPTDGDAPVRTLLAIVRHGRTPTTGQVLPGRAIGLHLSDEGTMEAAATASWLQDSYPTPSAIYSSPMERAMETASPYSELTGVPITVEDLLLECDFGAWTGRELKELSKLEEWRVIQSTPSRFRFPEGESLREMSNRMNTFLSKVATEHQGETVVAFSHADPIKALVTDVLGLHLDAFQRIFVSTASVTLVSFDGTTPHLLASNTNVRLPGRAT